MKKFFSILGMASLICLSLVISKKTTTVVQDMDELMIEIKNKEKDYYVEPIDAIINNNQIVPGLNGRKVNVKKSYDEIKKIGTFNDKYLIYEDIKPNITSKGNYDKVIISGNKNKNMITLMFNVYANDDITDIVNILKKKNVSATFFIDGAWFEKNNEYVLKLIKDGYTIGNLGYNNDYSKTEFVWMNNILKKIGKQKINYCYDTDNIYNLNSCINQKNYTIKPSILIKDNPLIEIK